MTEAIWMITACIWLLNICVESYQDIRNTGTLRPNTKLSLILMILCMIMAKP